MNTPSCAGCSLKLNVGLIALGIAVGTLLPAFVYGIRTAPMIIFAAVLLALSGIAMHRLAGVFNLRRLTLPAFWYLSYAAIIYIPAFYVYFDHPGRRRDTYILAVETVMATVPFGVWFACKLLGFTKDEIEDYYQRPLEDGSSAFTGAVFSVMAFAAVLLTALYIHETPTLPILYLLRNPGDALTSLRLREEAYALLDSRLTYLYFILKSFIYPFLICFAFGRYLISRNRKRLVVFTAMLALGVFYAGVTTSKSEVAGIFMAATLFLYLYKKGEVGNLFPFAGPALVIAFPALVFTLLYPEHGGVTAALLNVGERLFRSPADVTYYYFEIFPDNVGYLYGASIGKLAWLTGHRLFDATVYVKQYMNDFLADSGSANGAFIGDANANFGMTGVVAEGLFVGAMLQAVQIYILRERKTVLSVSLFAFLFAAFWMINITALQVALLSDGAFFSLLLYWTVTKAELSFERLRAGRRRGSKTGNVR